VGRVLDENGEKAKNGQRKLKKGKAWPQHDGLHAHLPLWLQSLCNLMPFEAATQMAVKLNAVRME